MKTLNDTNDRYGLVSQVLHWGLALLIIATFFIGQSLEDAPRADKGGILFWHMSFAVLVVGFFVVRGIWRASQTSPVELNENRKLALVHKVAVLALYVLPFALAASGSLAVLSMGRPVALFGFELVSGWTVPDRDFHKLMEGVHGVGAKALFFLVILHILASLWHQFIKRDGALARMLPALGSTKSDETAP